MKILSLLPAAAAAILLLASCDSTPESERYTIVDASEFEPQRTVLIEEFTGQTCVNCPGAHELLKELDGKFNTAERVGFITVGIHYSDFGMPVPRGFVTDESDIYAANAKVANAPSARINRRTEAIGTDQWTGSLLTEMIRKSSVNFTILTADLNANSNTISINGKIYASESVKNTRLQLWLVEDDIVAPQMLKDGADPYYVHHSVFRATINGINGQNINLGDKKETEFKVDNYPLPEYVSTDHLRVVAFVYNNDDGVLNAHQCSVLKSGGGIQILVPDVEKK